MKTIKAKSINFIAKFRGDGCVNYDHLDQKNYLYEINALKGQSRKNLKLAKKDFGFDENGNEGFRYKVCSDCLRHFMWEEEMPRDNENIQQLNYVLYTALGNPASIERGYFYTPSKTHASNSKKTIVTICDAYEQCPQLRHLVNIEFHSRAAKKENLSKKDAETDEDVSKTTLIYGQENVGVVNYESKGAIMMSELQFISFDETYGRCGVNIDNKENLNYFMSSIKRNIPNSNGKIGYFYLQTSRTKDEWAEKGLLLDKDSVDFLVKDVIRRILTLHIYKRDAMFECTSLTISYSNEEGITQSFEISMDTLNDYYFEVIQTYNEASEELIIENVKKAEELAKKAKGK